MTRLIVTTFVLLVCGPKPAVKINHVNITLEACNPPGVLELHLHGVAQNNSDLPVTLHSSQYVTKLYAPTEKRGALHLIRTTEPNVDDFDNEPPIAIGPTEAGRIDDFNSSAPSITIPPMQEIVLDTHLTEFMLPSDIQSRVSKSKQWIYVSALVNISPGRSVYWTRPSKVEISSACIEKLDLH